MANCASAHAGNKCNATWFVIWIEFCNERKGITDKAQAETLVGRIRAIAEDRFPFSTGATFDVDGCSGTVAVRRA